MTGPKVEIIDSPIPEPSEDQVLIHVVVSGYNPKDWKMAVFRGVEGNPGDDIAGYVAKVGANVTEFKPGDRVAGFHEMGKPHGSYAEYAIAWQHTTFHIPNKTSFEEAAALPLAAMTAAIGLYVDHGLPLPWTPVTEPFPLLVYGAASAVGAYAVQLAAKSNIHPIICVAGVSAPYVETLIDRSKGDTIIDYREGNEAVVAGLKKALGGTKVLHAFDAISEHNSYQNLTQVISPGATLNTVLPLRDFEVPQGITYRLTLVGRVFSDQQDFGFLFFRYFGRGLQQGWFHGQPQEVVPGGLAGVEGALANLQAGKANGIKYEFRISETPGAGKDTP